MKLNINTINVILNKKEWSKWM